MYFIAVISQIVAYWLHALIYNFSMTHIFDNTISISTTALTLIVNIKIFGGTTHLNLLKWLKKLSSCDNQFASTSCKTPAISDSDPHEFIMLTAPLT